MKNIIGIALLILLSHTAHANNDMGNRKLAPAIVSAFDSADKVFVGTALASTDKSAHITFYVNEWFKGKHKKKVLVSCKTIKGSCINSEFNAGMQYLVYASKSDDKDIYHVYQDTVLTKPFHLADLDVELLRDMDHPFYWYDDAAWWFDE